MIPWDRVALKYREHCIIGSILNPLAGKFSEDTRKKGKGAKTGASHDWQRFYLSQYDWLKGSHMTKVVWLPTESDYSHCKFVAPNTPFSLASYQPSFTQTYQAGEVHHLPWQDA